MRHSGVTEQQKASLHRRKDAEILRAAGRWRGSMYLLGYAIECSLKSTLMQKHGTSTLSLLQHRLSHRLDAAVDVQTHSLKQLMAWTGTEHRMDRQTRILWGEVSKWTVDWRYNPDLAGEAECERFFEAGLAVLGFIQRNV